VLEQHEQLWNVALQSYQDEMTRDPELADPGDIFNNWVWSTKVGGYIAEADNSALGSYARSFDQLRGRRRRNGEKFTMTWSNESEEKANLAYRKTFDKAINAHPFARSEVAAYFQDWARPSIECAISGTTSSMMPKTSMTSRPSNSRCLRRPSRKF
jgi:hypothetical protein